MAISVARNAKSPPSPNPSHMLINSILIQTDDGRRYDSSIVYNRIIDDPYYRKRRSSLKTVIICFLTIAITAYLLVSESIGFSSFPLAVTDRKYLGRKPNIGSADEDFASSEDNDVKEALSLADDEVDDELRGTGDDDTQAMDVNASSGREDQDEDIQRSASRDDSTATDADHVQDASGNDEGPVSIDKDADGDDDSSSNNEEDEEVKGSSISDHDEIGNGEDSTNISGQHLQSTPEEKELNQTIDNTELRVEHNSTTHDDGGELAEENNDDAADGFSPANKEDISDVDNMQNEGEYEKGRLKQYDAASLDAVESTVLSHLRAEQDNLDDINEEKTEYKSGDEGSDTAPVEAESNAG